MPRRFQVCQPRGDPVLIRLFAAMRPIDWFFRDHNGVPLASPARTAASHDDEQNAFFPVSQCVGQAEQRRP